MLSLVSFCSSKTTIPQQIDATVETELGSKYGVQGYPTIKYFMDGGDAQDYDGGRKSDDIVSWVSKMTGPAVKVAADAAAFEALKKENRVLAVFFGEEDSADAKSFEKVAKANRGAHVFAAVYDAALQTAEGVDAGSVAVYKTFDENKDVTKYTEDFLTFVKASSFPIFDEIGPDNYKNYVDRGLPIGWLFVDPADTEKTASAKAAVEAAGKALKGKISLVWLSGVQYGQMAGRVGLSGKVWPSFGIDDNGEHFGFDESKDITEEAIAAWTGDWAEGKLVATVKSDPVPEEPTVGGVTTIVGETFKSIVFDESKDVFIKFYAPWCGHCKSMIPAYDQLGKTFEDNENVVIGKFDATTNDAPKGFNVEGFPTLKFVKAGSNDVCSLPALPHQSTQHNKPHTTSQIVDYSGGRDFEGMEAFIKENANL